MKPVVFLGDALARIRAFPQGGRREAGYQIERVQRGLEPNDWKPMKTVGTGVREIRVRDAQGAYRVFYLATLRNAIYVLHAFEKKTRKTPDTDIAVAARRFRALKRGVADE